MLYYCLASRLTPLDYGRQPDFESIMYLYVLYNTIHTL